jgi:beta-phosphoglucomutase-like phosphatase (HAD superfamily)
LKHNENLATNVYTPKALSRTGIPVPAAGYITADDVERGKPEPDPYLAGAARVGVDPKNCTSTHVLATRKRERERSMV